MVRGLPEARGGEGSGQEECSRGWRPSHPAKLLNQEMGAAFTLSAFALFLFTGTLQLVDLQYFTFLIPGAFKEL